MSAFEDELRQGVASAVKTPWSSEKDQVVPEGMDLRRGNHRKELDATFLYADLADSSEPAMRDPEEASEFCKACLAGVSKLIKKNGGEVNSFDGTA